MTDPIRAALERLVERALDAVMYQTVDTHRDLRTEALKARAALAQADEGPSLEEARAERDEALADALAVVVDLGEARAEIARLREKVALLEGWKQGALEGLVTPGGFGTHRILLTQEAWERFQAYLHDDHAPSEGLMRLLAGGEE